MKMGGGLAPLSQPVSTDQVSPVREYMRQWFGQDESPSEPVLKVPKVEQRGFIIGGERL